MIRALLASTALLVAAPAFADGHLESEQVETVAQVGPTVGQAAPALSAVTSAGDAATLATVSGANGVALVFFRSADWCPFCKKQLLELNPVAADLEASGWPVVGVSYDSAETLADFKAKNELAFTLLSDEGSATIDAFGLRNLEVAGGRVDGIPHPAVVFVRTDGTVAGVMREDGYRDRPQVEAITDAATLLNEAAAEG